MKSSLGLVAFAAIVIAASAQPLTGDENLECRDTNNPEARWRRSCNWCSCTEKGLAICTRRGCPSDFEVRIPEQKQCEGDAEWRTDCNWCKCVAEKADCSTDVCPAEENTPEPASTLLTRSSSPAVPKELEKECEAFSTGASWRDACNWCTCSTKGLAQCTRKMCRPNFEEKSENSEECSGEVRWKKGCNTCQCVDGVSVCSIEDCSEDGTSVIRNQPAKDCKAGLEGGRWRWDCNWCSCSDEGMGLCTKKGCLSQSSGSTRKPTLCEGNLSWKEDCNHCRCVNGESVCTTNNCDTKAANADACSDGQTWIEGCNTCMCNNGVSLCTRILCAEGRDNTIQPSVVSSQVETLLEMDASHGTAQCKEGSRWRQDCNWCSCNDGVGICTLMACIPGAGAKMKEPFCEEGSQWMVDCNLCMCTNGVPVCTEKFCSTEETKSHQFNPTLQVATRKRSVDCTEGSRWKDECNSCFCSNGMGACTLKFCIAGRTSPGPQCENGSEWRGKNCTWCKCEDEKAVCTPIECEDETWKGATGITPALSVATRRTLIQANTGGTSAKQSCKPGSRWVKQCNWCTCLESGVEDCAEEPCTPETSQNLHGTCEGDASWMDECNRCTCSNGRGVCTLRACEVASTNITPAVHGGHFRMKSNPGEEKEPTCIAGSRWMKQCNWCTCGENGVGICEQKACLTEQAQSLHGTCEGEARWKEDCNWCNCVNGRGVCTLKGCLTISTPLATNSREALTCLDGSNWKDDCNTCVCANGNVVCTRRACLPQRVRSNTCVEGESFKDDCNNCICINGQGACTKKKCLASRAEEIPEVCNLPSIQPGAELCGGFETKWTYNAAKSGCEEILYGGCGGTENLFTSEDECHTTCGNTKAALRQAPVDPRERCYEPVVEGPCFANLVRFAFSQDLNRCEKFIYGGCQGNQNNFQSVEECHELCGGAPPTVASNCDRSKCDWKRVAHYIWRECKPIYEGGACCPTQFACASEEDRGLRLDRCYYGGVEFSDGEDFEVDEVCRVGCRCLVSPGASEPGLIVCASLECPSIFQTPKPGCRDVYTSPDQCCTDEMECTDPNLPPVAVPRSAQCSWKGKTWQIGSKMDFDDDECQFCVCTAEFTDPRGPGCQKISCGYDIDYRSDAFSGCTPIFFESSCCPIGFMCPGDSRLQGVAGKPQGIDVLRSGECSLGELSVPVGSSVAVSDCHLRCSCDTPPELTCVQYRSCESAEQSEVPKDEVFECPKVQCPSGCTTVLDSSTGCPTCFCSNLNYTCPEPTCPQVCKNAKTQFDETTGCYFCKCECRTDYRGLPNCPMDCITKIIFDKETACDKCVCDSSRNSLSISTGGS